MTAPATTNADVVIAGAGIAGVSLAYHLAVRHGLTNVVLCDPRPPLTLTSDKSTECYRNWWPQPSMVGLMNRSIDLLDELSRHGDFALNRRGYVYLTASDVSKLESDALAVSSAGGGRLRIHRALEGPAPCEAVRGWDRVTDGADLVTDPDLIRRLFPSVTKDVVAALHVRKAGWLRAQQLGTWLLECARSAGVILVARSVEAVRAGRAGGFQVDLDGGECVETPVFVDAAGPMLAPIAKLLGENLPVRAERHLKLAFKDHEGAIPRAVPLMIWNDPQRIDWDSEEAATLPDRDLLGDLPAGCHLRPDGGADSPWVLGLWEFRRVTMPPVFPVPTDPLYEEVVLRGLARMFPGLTVYRERLPKGVVDGGYYIKTPENLPIIGPLRTRGAFVLGALSGFGVMASQGAAELLALHITGGRLPPYADAFRLERYDDEAYLGGAMNDIGQL
jgi:sarcosine oxidase subunit beta